MPRRHNRQVPLDQLITGSSFCPRCAAPVAAADAACAACGASLHSAAPATNAATGLGDTSTEGPDSRTRLAAGTRILPPLTVGTRATDGLQPGEAFGTRYRIIKLLGVGRHGRRLPGVGRRARHHRRHQDDSTRHRHRPDHGAPTPAPLQARARARSAGHAPQRGAHPRPRRDRRHQVHHDAVRRRPDAGRDPGPRGAPAGGACARHLSPGGVGHACRAREGRGASGSQARQHHDRGGRRLHHGLRHRPAGRGRRHDDGGGRA